MTFNISTSAKWTYCMPYFIEYSIRVKYHIRPYSCICGYLNANFLEQILTAKITYLLQDLYFCMLWLADGRSQRNVHPNLYLLFLTPEMQIFEIFFQFKIEQLLLLHAAAHSSRSEMNIPFEHWTFFLFLFTAEVRIFSEYCSNPKSINYHFCSL